MLLGGSTLLTNAREPTRKGEFRREAMEGRPAPRSHGCNCLETVLFWGCGEVDCGKARESLKPGTGPMGIITWKQELLVVPISGQWAA